MVGVHHKGSPASADFAMRDHFLALVLNYGYSTLGLKYFFYLKYFSFIIKY